MKVGIIGAGFSGLVLGYYLTKKGLAVDIYDEQTRVGGIIETVVSPWGQYEKAAGSFLNSPQIEQISQEIGVPLKPLPSQGKRKYLYWNKKPRRFPFGIRHSAALFRLICLFVFKNKRYKPLPQETVGKWAKRVLGSDMQKLLCTALQGIYGSQTEGLSASLVFQQSLLNSKKQQRSQKTRLGRGSVYPKTGMEAWMKAMQSWLTKNGARFFLGQSIHKDQVKKNYNSVVLCLAAHRLGQGGWGDLFAPFAKLKYNNIIAVQSFRPWRTANTKKTAPRICGFDCLFPKQSGFHSLGVIFPEGQFQSQNAPYIQEKWLLDGEPFKQSGNTDICKKIESDFYKLYKREPHFRHYKVIRYAHALPRYDVYLENILKEKPVQTGRYYLFGNYMGCIGLSRLTNKAEELAQKIYTNSYREIY